MKKVLVTGGAGYIGAHCCKELAARGYEPVVFDSLAKGHREFVRWGELFQGDITAPADLDRCFQHHDIGAVLHFAGFIEVGESVKDPAKYYGNNVSGTLELLAAMVRHGVGDFIFSSSAAVYGYPEKVPIGEDHPLSPVNPYGWTKLMVETMLGDFEAAHGIRWVALRYFNAAGADADAVIGERHQPESHLIPRLLLAALNGGGSVSIYGTDYPTADGTCVRDFVHVCDLARAHVLALEYMSSGAPSTVFNLGQGRGYSVREVVGKVRELTGVDLPVVEEARRPGDPAVLIASNARAREILGWEPVDSGLENILSSAWRWHRSSR